MHAFHVHETGTCEPPFDSAGGHYNPSGLEHGYLAAAGHHAGDLPNFHLPESGQLEIEMFNALLLLDEQPFDEDGASIIVHEGVDDYESQPSGAAGARISCGVIEQAFASWRKAPKPSPSASLRIRRSLPRSLSLAELP